MSVIDALILGLLQGLTEFIPVSSSGHLVLADNLSSVDSNFSFDVLINIGTLAALVIYFRAKLLDIGKHLLRPDNLNLLKLVAITSLPAVVAGLFFTDFFSSDSTRNYYVVAVMLISVGALMVVVDRLPGKKSYEKLNRLSALGIGLAQALALVPGTSRSGSTIVAGRLAGLSAKAAAEYSFIAAIPVLFGAVVFSLFDAESINLIKDNTGALLAGTVAAFASGLWAIGFMLKFLQTKKLAWFGYYRIILGVIVLLTAV